MTDGNYIQGFLVNDQEVIGKFYGECYTSFISHFVTRYKKSEEYAQDLFHDSLIALHENVRDGKLTEQSLTRPLFYYLRGVGRNKMMSMDRKNKELGRISLVDYGEEDEISDYKDIAKAIEGVANDEENERRLNDLQDFVERAVKDMRPPCDKLLRRFYWERMSYAQIIKVMDFATADSAKTQKNKCMNKLKPVVEKFRKLR